MRDVAVGRSAHGPSAAHRGRAPAPGRGTTGSTAARRRRRARILVMLSATLLTVPSAGLVPLAHASPLPHRRTAPAPQPSARQERSDCTQLGQLRRWRTRRLAAQVLVAPTQLSDVAAAEPLVRVGFGGLLLFGASAPEDLGQQVASLEVASRGGLDPVVMTDEEGGAVQRLRSLVGPVPSARRMGQTMSPRRIRRIGLRVGQRMHAAGVTMDLAPVLDLDDRPGPSATNPDGTRSFGMDPTQVSADALAFARGLRASAVTATVKHFPGLGHATGNTDVGPAATLPWRVLRHHGLRPFRVAVGAGIPAVMVSNATVPGLTARPGTLSPTVMRRVLRRHLGFGGAVVTDSLSAGAIRAAGLHAPRAAVASLSAGADLVLFGGGSTTGVTLARRVLTAVTQAGHDGRLSRHRLVSAAAHVLRLKRVDLCAA